jgi:hypothetical protein
MSEQRNMPVPVQPPNKRLAVPSYYVGSKRSAARLRQLRFDPIQELVENYRKIQLEVERQEKIRDGQIIELSASGKPRSYRSEVHHALFDKLNMIGEKLLRYGYGRVPEVSELNDAKPTPLVINLTKKGETYVVNEQDEIDDNDHDED